MTSLAGKVIGRYTLYDRIASGGMGSVHIGRQIGLGGFARLVAIKRLHGHLATDPELVAMFLDEGRIAARIRHANVVTTLDVGAIDGELILVMDYVHGDSLSAILAKLRAQGQRLPLEVVSTIVCEALYGLHAAHEAKGERGEPLGIIHRDISPHNLLVGTDGVTRVVDFGVAKAHGRIRTTADAGAVRGKLSYMAMEQLFSLPLDRRADIYSMGVVLWEAITAQRYNDAASHGAAIHRAIHEVPPSIRDVVPDVSDALHDVLYRALQRDRAARFDTAEEMARALGAAVPQAPPPEVGAIVLQLCGDAIHERAELLARIESAAATDSDAIIDDIKAGRVPGEYGVSAARAPVPGSEPPASATRAATPAAQKKKARDEATNEQPTHRSQVAPYRSATAVRVGIGMATVALAGSTLYWNLRPATPQPTKAAEPEPATSASGSSAASGGLAEPSASLAITTPPSAAVSTVRDAPSARPAEPASASPKARPTPSTPLPRPPPPASALRPPSRPCVYYENGIKIFNPDCLKGGP